jgi:leader peptidase (prepilin peptidase)/N-methyltransferase
LDLVPVLGYFFLRGECRYCGAPISFRYPLVEFLTGASFVGLAVSLPAAKFPLDFIFYLVVSGLLLIIFFTDLEHQVVPDSVSVSGIFLGLSFNYIKGIFFFRGPGLNPFFSSLYGMLLGYVLFSLIAKLGRQVFKKEAMGEGDIYLAAFLGAALGWEGVLLATFLAYLLAGIVLLAPLIIGKVKFGQEIPFGPALVAGAFMALFFKHQLIGWYLNFIFR